MIRIKHYNTITDNHRLIEIDRFADEDRTRFIHNFLQTCRERSDVETLIRWGSSYPVELEALKDVPYGIRSLIRRRPSPHLVIPAITIRRETQSSNYDLDWEDLIELPRTQNEQLLMEFLDDYLSKGLLE